MIEHQKFELFISFEFPKIFAELYEQAARFELIELAGRIVQLFAFLKELPLLIKVDC
jgi:hypothetical protein